jgi:uncharacterized membrane protein YhaH (DUF805 family)
LITEGANIAITLMVVFVSYIIPIVAVYTDKQNYRSSRKTFFYWCAAGFVILFFIFISREFFISRLGGFDGNIFSLFLTLLILFFFNFPFFRQISRRARDAGLGKWIAYVAITLPPVEVIVCLVLLFRSSESLAIAEAK